MNDLATLEVIRERPRAASALHPLRGRILGALADSDSSSGVARRLGLARQKVNYHVRQLESDRLIAFVGERRRGNFVERLYRATARTYLIAPEALGSLAAEPGRLADRFSSAYLAAAAARTIQDLAELRPRADRAGKTLPTLTLESEVRFASPEDQKAFADELSKAFTRIAAKYHTHDSAAGRSFRFFAGGYPAVHRTPPREASK